MLDEQHGAPFARHLAHQPRDRGGLLGVHARGRLVEEHQRRLRRQGARDLHPALLAVGKAERRGAGPLAQSDAREQRLGGLAGRALLALGRGQEQQPPPERSAPAEMLADHHVVGRGEPREQADVLVGARHTQLGHPMRRQAIDAAPVQLDPPAGGLEQAGDEVEQRGLARAVGTDQAVHLGIGNGEGGVVHRADAAERARDAGEAEAHAAPRARRRKRSGRETRPLGR